MGGYKTKQRPFSGTSWSEVSKNARYQYKIIESRAKRRPYVRAAYFSNQKIFLGLFWHHLHEKFSLKDKTRRLKFFPCAIELIQNSHIIPTVKVSTNHANELLYRFMGITPTGHVFFVQIKENIRTHEKCLISIFPETE